MGIARFMPHLRHVDFDVRFLQQVDAWSLLTSNRAAELRDEESSFQRFGESPARLQAPFSGQGRVFSLHAADIAGNLNRNSLATKGGSAVGANRLPIAIELD